MARDYITWIIVVKTDALDGFNDAQDARPLADKCLEERGELGDWTFSDASLKNYDIAMVEYHQ